MELAELVAELRSELQHAMEGAADEPIRFELGPVELEVTVAVGRDSNAGGKVRFWVVEVGAEGTMSSSSMQRIRLTLNPKLAIDGSAPFISGRGQPGED